VAPSNADVHDPKKCANQILTSDLERKAFHQLLSLGLEDTFRLYCAEIGQYTWWDYRSRGFAGNRGFRIDHVLCSYALAPALQQCIIDKTFRAAKQPSDHAPFLAYFKNIWSTSTPT
jgi:exodeoxyribonuclease-3